MARRCWRSDVPVANPTSAAILSIERSLVSSKSRARSSRWRVAKLDFITSLGVDEAVDYRSTDITTIDVVDVVLAFVGGADRLRSLATLKPGGILVTSVPDEEYTNVVARAAELNVRAGSVFVEHDRTAMAGIAALAADGKLRPQIERIYPLEDAALAHEAIETGRVAGKLVLDVTE